jgi:uncharacterized protein YceK
MIYLKKTAVSFLVATVLVSGCATSSDKIAASYISPMQYQSYDCDQISAEGSRLSQRVISLQGQVDKAASNDKALTGVGVILFFPVLFALGGNQQQEAEYGRLKGEAEALQQAAVLKKCSGVMAASASAANAGTLPAPTQIKAAP